MRLSSQAIQILEELKDHSELTVEDLEAMGYDQSMVNRAALELEEKDLVEVEEEEVIGYELTGEGEEIVEEGSPEYRLVERVSRGEKQLSELENLELDVALGKAREKNWVEVDQGEVYLTEPGEDAEDVTRQRLEEGEFDEEIQERGLVEVEKATRRELLLSERGDEIEPDEIEEDFNVEARTKTPRTGKKHFYKQIIEYANKTWREMGFKEMEGSFIQPGFWCFDSLYIPQDHPARELQDTFFMKKPEKSDLSEQGDYVERVKQTHENGWETGSSGWEYDWSEKEASRNVLRTHTTGVSAQKLAELEKKDLPAKFFTTSRVFRNETIDRYHNAEFYQSDGIVVGEDLNFVNLKAYLSQFFEKMGYDQFRLIPSYYPYTEMSVEVQVWDSQEKEWIGLGGSGMFRPEVVKPMLGFEATVLAWGLGIPRIAMRSAGLEDVRELYRNDIELLENTSVWRPNL
ncbi:MAG: phenylalanine--tRNA ligase subunit alpha [Candidatus Nanohaloarchaea archaeon]